MIKHIVMWKLKNEFEGNTKSEMAMNIKNGLESLKNIIDVIVNIEVGINFVESEQAYDIVLYSVFNNKDDLSLYQIHPEHIKVAKYIGKVSEKRKVVDYEI